MLFPQNSIWKISVSIAKERGNSSVPQWSKWMWILKLNSNWKSRFYFNICVCCPWSWWNWILNYEALQLYYSVSVCRIHLNSFFQIEYLFAFVYFSRLFFFIKLFSQLYLNSIFLGALKKYLLRDFI